MPTADISVFDISVEKQTFLKAFGLVPSSTGNYWSNRYRLRGEKLVKFTHVEIIDHDIEQLKDTLYVRLTEHLVNSRDHGPDWHRHRNELENNVSHQEYGMGIRVNRNMVEDNFANIVRPALANVFNAVYSSLNSGDPIERNAFTIQERAAIRHQRQHRENIEHFRWNTQPTAQALTDMQCVYSQLSGNPNIAPDMLIGPPNLQEQMQAVFQNQNNSTLQNQNNNATR